MGVKSSSPATMNEIGSSEVIKIEGYEIKLPKFKSEASESDGILFEKPGWMLDENCTLCFNCQQTFTRLRRKHHCRNCGNVFCNKCCNDKVVLLQYGWKNVKRVCINCKTSAVLVSKCISSTQSVKNESALGLSKLLPNVSDLCKVVESGGLYSMIFVAMAGDQTIKIAVASSLHCVTQRLVLNQYLVEAGCLKLFKQVLSTCDCSEYLVLTNILGSLSVLCQDDNIKLQVLREEIINPLLVILNGSGTPCLFACRILLLLFENISHHIFILKTHPSVVYELVKNLREKSCEGDDYHVLESITKMLVYLAAGSDVGKEMLLYEDEAHGSPLIALLRHPSYEILLNVTCTIANMATAAKDRPFSHNYIGVMCEVLNVINKETIEIITNLGRALANFSEWPTNILALVHHLPSIISNLMVSGNENHRYHACRIIIRLLSTETSATIQVLSSSGVDPFLSTLFTLPGVNDLLNSVLLQKVTKITIS